jgi:hypothetical protein
MGMSLETFLGLTPHQFRIARTRFFERISKERQQAELTAWQVARWQVFRTLCPPTEKQIRITDLVKLPGDEGFETPKPPESTKERFEKLADSWKDGR